MALTAKQQRAINRAKGEKSKKQLRQNFLAQSARQPQRQRQAPRGPSGPRTHFDAFASGHAPLAFSVGRATHLRGLARQTFQVTDPGFAGMTHHIVILQGGPGHVVGYTVRLNKTTPTISAWNTITMGSAGFSASGPSASSPDTALAARFSVRLRNISPAIEVAGQCYALNMTSGANLSAAPDYVALVDYVMSHPRTVTFSGHELRSARQWNTHPVDQSKYHEFIAPSTDVAGMLSRVADPGLSTLVLVFPVVPSTGQEYELTAVGTYYGRYRVTGPLAHAAEEPPTIPMQAANAARDIAERVGSVGFAALQQAATSFGQGLANRAFTRITGGVTPEAFAAIEVA